MLVHEQCLSDLITYILQLVFAIYNLKMVIRVLHTKHTCLFNVQTPNSALMFQCIDTWLILHIVHCMLTMVMTCRTGRLAHWIILYPILP